MNFLKILDREGPLKLINVVSKRRFGHSVHVGTCARHQVKSSLISGDLWRKKEKEKCYTRLDMTTSVPNNVHNNIKIGITYKKNLP